jgi:gliding motility-associated-like protein
MKKLYFLFFSVLLYVAAFAEHITGGEMYYVLVGQSGNDYTYRVTLKLYRDCFSSGAQLDGAAAIAVFNNATFTQVSNTLVPLSGSNKQQLTDVGPCIQNPPAVCYDVGFYTFTITLPASSLGYTIVYQRCCRIQNISNLTQSGSAGATYTAQIPGTSLVTNGPLNNSAKFTGKDEVVVCANNRFFYDFGASDIDNDSLSFEFCSAYTSQQMPPNPNPPAGPPYMSVSYKDPYSASAPLGTRVTIDRKTGMVSGIAPPIGIYTVTVCVTEWRDGKPISTQRKDLQIKVGDCNIAAAVPIALDINGAIVNPDNASCRSFSFNFKNDIPPNPLVHSYYWEFGDGATSTDPTPAHTYADTGTYEVTLTINKGEECSGYSTTRLAVYPGFTPGFTASGICLYNPTLFTDTTKTTYGIVNSWKWDFGKPNATDDISQVRNPSYTYGQAGSFSATLIVSTSKGCVDTVVKSLTIIDKPAILLPFKDTLICRGDILSLRASGNGNFSWTPSAGMTNPNSANPVVSPVTTTTYTVQLNDNSCINTDTVRVRVISVVTLRAMNDTTICRTDAIQLGGTTDGLQFAWTPAATLSDPGVLNPIARPLSTTTYKLRATVGSCSASDSITVKVVPYPVANAGLDKTICYSTSTPISASIVGSSFTWSPASSLNNPNTLSPVASPLASTSYVLSAYDTLGCPKPGRDTAEITVLPKINAFAGRDTAIIAGQPLQFNASGGVSYLWSPATGLNKNNINNPVGIYDGSFDSIRYVVTVGNENGCTATAEVGVRIFNTKPSIFVPSGFTPNGDGKNDVIRPIPVGITRITYFRIYNRWGQLVFNSTSNQPGWNGKIAGKEQGAGTFVWIARAEDYSGKIVFAKGTVTLIR